MFTGIVKKRVIAILLSKDGGAAATLFLLRQENVKNDENPFGL